MNDMRQKLLPVFLEEAARKILQLDDFIAAGSDKVKSLADLEVAFRAAHTLKGTAALVQAEAVRALSARIEGLLEGHFERSSFPSAIEYEAMQLSLERLKLLIEAVAKGHDEPAGLLAEAELALKLALAMPGRKRFAEISASEGSVDPFADDPNLEAFTNLYSATSFSEAPDDPFADDPEIDQFSAPAERNPSNVELAASDPFADDDNFDMGFMDEATSSSKNSAMSYSDINDPFAEDPALEFFDGGGDVEPEPSDPLVSSSADTLTLSEEAPAVEIPPPPSSKSQSAESFIDRMRKRMESESPLQTAERLAKTLLSQSDSDAVARQYACCCFRVAAKDYYLPIANMVEISDLPNIIRLPLAPAVVRGLINLRGQVLPVVDLGLQFGGISQHVAVRKLVIAEAAGEKLAFLSDGIPNLSEDILGEKVDVMNFVDQFRAGAS